MNDVRVQNAHTIYDFFHVKYYYIMKNMTVLLIAGIQLEIEVSHNTMKHTKKLEICADVNTIEDIHFLQDIKKKRLGFREA